MLKQQPKMQDSMNFGNMFDSGFISIDGKSRTNHKSYKHSHKQILNSMNDGYQPALSSVGNISSSKETLYLREQIKAQAMHDLNI